MYDVPSSNNYFDNKFRIQVADSVLKQEVLQCKILYVALHCLIWGEATNLRFMAEYLCYIFQHVSLLPIAVTF